MYLLDTNVVSELRRPRPHGAVLAWIRSVPNAALHISAATVGELRRGIEITREQDQAKAAQFDAWLVQVAQTYTVLAMDADTFDHWARLMHRRSDTLVLDAMIAATAQQHGLMIVSRNVADFQQLGLQVLNPFM